MLDTNFFFQSSHKPEVIPSFAQNVHFQSKALLQRNKKNAIMLLNPGEDTSSFQIVYKTLIPSSKNEKELLFQELN